VAMGFGERAVGEGAGAEVTDEQVATHHQLESLLPCLFFCRRCRCRTAIGRSTSPAPGGCALAPLVGSAGRSRQFRCGPLAQFVTRKRASVNAHSYAIASGIRCLTA
jgi:hypothetical protein